MTSGERRNIVVGLIFLTVFNVILFSIYLGWVIPLKGFIVYGDLPALYLFPPFNLLALKSLVLYSVFAQLVSFVTGVVVAQDTVFFGTLFLPSYGIYFFLREFKGDIATSVVLSVMFGTILSPLLFSEFLGGGFEYFPWLFFLFLSLKFLVRSVNNGNVFRNTVISAAFYGLSITTTGFFPNGLYMSFFFILMLIFRRVGSYKDIKREVRIIALFLPVALIITSDLIFHAILYNLGFLSSSSSPGGQAYSYVFSTMQYEFRVYHSGISFFGGVWGGGSLGFFSTTLDYIFFLLSMIGGVFSFVFRYEESWIVRRFFIVYLASGGLIYALSYTSVQHLYLSLRIFDTLEYPSYFLLIQTVSAVLLAFNFINVFSSILVKGSVNVYKTQKLANGRAEGSGFIDDHENLLGVGITKKIVATMIAILFIVGSMGLIVESHSLFKRSQGSPFVPENLLELHDWYSSNSENISGDLFILPSYSVFYMDAAHAALPGGLLSNKVQSGAPLAGFNYSSLNSLYSLPDSNSSLVYANYLGLLNDQYVILYNFTGLQRLSGNGTVASYSSLHAFLSQSPYFSSVQNSSGYSVYINKEFYFSKQHVIYNIYQPPTKQGISTNILNASDYSGAYLGSDVSYTNGNLSLFGPDFKVSSFTQVYYQYYYSGGRLSKNNVNNLNSTASPFQKISYWFKSSVSSNINGSVSESVLYYNSTNPKGFYSYDHTQSLLSSTTSHTAIENVTLNIPKNTKMLRIIIYVAAASHHHFDTNVTGLSLHQELSTANINSDIGLQQFVMGSLAQSGAIKNSFNFISPAFYINTTDIAKSTNLTVAPLSGYGNNSSITFDFSPKGYSLSNLSKVFLIGEDSYSPSFTGPGAASVVKNFSQGSTRISEVNTATLKNGKLELNYGITYRPIAIILLW